MNFRSGLLTKLLLGIVGGIVFRFARFMARFSRRAGI